MQVPPYADDSLAEESSEEGAGSTGCTSPGGQPDALHTELQAKQAQVGCCARGTAAGIDCPAQHGTVMKMHCAALPRDLL